MVSVSGFFAMGGYGVYVWSAFGFTTCLMIALLVASWLSARASERELETLRREVRPARPARRQPIVARRAGADDPAAGCAAATSSGDN